MRSSPAAPREPQTLEWLRGALTPERCGLGRVNRLGTQAGGGWGRGRRRGSPPSVGGAGEGFPGPRGRRAFPATASSHLRLLRNMRGWRPWPPGPRLQRSGPLAAPVGVSIRRLLWQWRSSLLEGRGPVQQQPAASSSSVRLPPPHLHYRHKAKAGHQCTNTEHLLCPALTAAAGGRGAWRRLILTPVVTPWLESTNKANK